MSNTEHCTSLRDMLALVLAGGRGTRLGSLTALRAKPALPVGGRYRLIDFTLSNCLNSDIRRVGVLTQYKSESLAAYLDCWSGMARRERRALQTLAASGMHPYRGTADAVSQNRDIIRTLAPPYVLVLAADHVYRMDYGAMLTSHQRLNAQVTVGCVEVPIAQASAFGVMETGADDRITSFVEKPTSPKPIPGRNDVVLASMGIYIFETGFLLAALADDERRGASTRDFGKDVLPHAVAEARVHAHRLRDPVRQLEPGYWRDVGTIDSYWRTNLEIAGHEPGFPIEDDWPIRSAMPRRLGAKGVVEAGQAASTCIRSVVFPGAHVSRDAHLEDSIVLPGARVGHRCLLRKAIVDEGCCVADRTIVADDALRDRRRFEVSPNGVVLASTQHVRVAAPISRERVRTSHFGGPGAFR